MDYEKIPTRSGTVLIKDADLRYATEEQGELAKALQVFLPELAAVAGTVRIAIGLDRFMKAHAAAWLVNGQGAAHALREIADYLEWSAAEIGEAAHVERDVSAVRAAAKSIDAADGIGN